MVLKGITRRHPVLKSVSDQLGIIIGLFLLCLFLSLYSDHFLTVRNFFNIFRQLSINMFLSCGMLLVILIAGIDLSIGSIMAVSGVLCAGFITFYDFSCITAVILSLLCGCVIGLINGLIISSTNIPSFIITLATMNIGRGFARLYTNSTTITVDNDYFSFIGTGYLFGRVPIQLVYIIIVVFATWFILNRTKLGRHIYATGGNALAAKFAGINTKLVAFFVFIFSSLMAAFSGIVLASRMFSGTSTAGSGAEMDAIAAVILGGTSMSGGIGTVLGTVIGVILIAVLSNGMNLLGINSSWQYIVKGVVIILAVYIDYLKKAKRQ